MKKRLILLLTTLLLLFNVTGCGKTYAEAIGETTGTSTGGGYFTEIVKWRDEEGQAYQIVYANDTHVKYLISNSGYQYGITPLYNADGSLQIYEGE